MTPCPDEATILAFGRGEGDPALRRLVTEHMTECDECRSLVSAVVRSSSMVPAARPVEPVLEPTVPVAMTAESPVKTGEVLAGKYVIERVLGAGGMGVVVAAWHVQLEQRFALKFLLPAACAVPDAIARFLREGKAAARITSEHVARVIDTGVLDGGAPYLVMEYLEGKDLGRAGILAPEDAVEYVLQAAEAIGEAHVLGIIHRDLKPANLFLAARKDGSPLVKVLDFGISKAVGEPSTNTPQLTGTAMMMGSPRYMSPEQMVSAKDVDTRTDVWALGVILYELVTGEAVWHADTVQGLCALIASAPAPKLRAKAPHAPAILEDVIARCLAKSPGDRLPSVADLALLLAPIASAPAQTSIDRILRIAGRSRSVPIPKPPPVLSGPASALGVQERTAPIGASNPALSQTPAGAVRSPLASAPPPSTGRVVMALVAVIALIGLGASGALLFRRDEAPPPPPVAAATVAAPAPVPTPSVEPAVAAVSALPAASVGAAKPVKPKHHAPVASASAAPAPDPDSAYTERK
jgi:serine/threonine-protein kinase